MRKLDAYIARTLILSILMAMGVLLALDIFFAFANELRYMGQGDYGFFGVLQVILLTIPRRMYQMFPMSGLIGAIMGLGVLAANRELVAMRAHGVSVARIGYSVMLGGMLIIAAMTVLGEGIAPLAEAKSQQMRAFALSRGQTVHTERGTWMRQGRNFIHIQTLVRGQSVYGFSLYEFNDDKALSRSTYAVRARFRHGEWHLEDVQETIFGDHSTETRRLPLKIWEGGFSPEVMQVVREDHLERLSLPELKRLMEYREANELSNDAYALAWWQKLLQPVSTLVMLMLAVPFVFGPLRSATMGMRLMIGILVGFGFYTVNHVFGPMTVVYQLPAFWGAALPAMIFGLIALRMSRSVS